MKCNRCEKEAMSCCLNGDEWRFLCAEHLEEEHPELFRRRIAAVEGHTPRWDFYRWLYRKGWIGEGATTKQERLRTKHAP